MTSSGQTVHNYGVIKRERREGERKRKGKREQGLEEEREGARREEEGIHSLSQK